MRHMSDSQYWKISELCERYLELQCPLMVCKSAAGYYIGVNTTQELLDKYPDAGLLIDEPLSRDSVEYYPTEEIANNAFKNRDWHQRWEP